MGRKTKFTRAMIKKAAKLIYAGNYQSHVAQALRIHRTTCSDVYKKGKMKKEEYIASFTTLLKRRSKGSYE